VGAAPKGNALEIKLPSFWGAQAARRSLLTQELSTLLNAGVPLDRSLSITAELTERGLFSGSSCLDVLRAC